jgi:uncharacterized membrane protein YidH (DUF202 family)
VQRVLSLGLLLFALALAAVGVREFVRDARGGERGAGWDSVLVWKIAFLGSVLVIVIVALLIGLLFGEV